MSSGQLLSVRGLQVNYGAAQALTGVSFDVGAGSVLAVVGANGAGKSSLARALSGLVQPRSGSVMLDGLEVAGMPAHRIRRLGLAHVPEGRAVFGTLTVRDNLRMSQRWLKTRPARGEALERALEMFPVLGRRLGQRASTLSGGEQQMLSLACELMVTPRLVIADELSFGLAPLIIDDVYEHLLRVRELGVSLIVIEQFIQRALAMADQVLLLRRGTVAWAGPAGQTTADDLLARYIGPDTQQHSTEAEKLSGEPNKPPTN